MTTKICQRELLVRFYTHYTDSNESEDTVNGPTWLSKSHAIICDYTAGVSFAVLIFQAPFGMSLDKSTIEALDENDRTVEMIELLTE